MSASNYLSHIKFRAKIKKVKKINDAAKIMGLDVGRKYTGVSISDNNITTSRPYKTIIGSPQLNSDTYSLTQNNAVFGEIRKIIAMKKIKGIVVGYPLNENGEPMVLCNFIERYLSHMWSLGIGKYTPVTLVNEYGSTMKAKVLIAE